jgi:hypothetical protein
VLSRTFRDSIAAIARHWLIAIQAFRILGGMFLVRYFGGQPPVFAIAVGIGDILTGISAPLVVYWWFSAKQFGRSSRRCHMARRGVPEAPPGLTIARCLTP